MAAAQNWKWEEKIGLGFFAGASTSPSRERLAEQAIGHGSLFDVRIFKPKDKFQREDSQKQQKFTSLEAHCQYKYLFHMPGVTYAARLKYLLLCNSTVLAPMLTKTGQGAQKPGGWFEFYYHALEEGKHYVDNYQEPAGEGGAKGGGFASIINSLEVRLIYDAACGCCLLGLGLTTAVL